MLFELPVEALYAGGCDILGLNSLYTSAAFGMGARCQAQMALTFAATCATCTTAQLCIIGCSTFQSSHYMQSAAGKCLGVQLPIYHSALSRLALARHFLIWTHSELAFKFSNPFATAGVPISQQMRDVSRGADIVVGTPGRIMDLQARGALDLSAVDFAILDEADQMLDIGFADDVEKILSEAPAERQTMLFSATMPTWVKKLTRKHQRDPLVVDLVGDEEAGKMAESIK